MSLKQKKIKFRPRIKLIQNIISIYIFGFQYGEEGGGGGGENIYCCNKKDKTVKN